MAVVDGRTRQPIRMISGNDTANLTVHRSSQCDAWEPELVGSSTQYQMSISPEVDSVCDFSDVF